jgi:hypothetical protein
MAPLPYDLSDDEDMKEEDDDGESAGSAYEAVAENEIRALTMQLASATLEKSMGPSARKTFVQDTMSLLVTDPSARRQLSEGLGLQSGA